MENIEIASLSNSIQNVNHGSDLKTKLLLSVSSDTIEKIEESNKKVNKSYKKKRKKKKKSIKQSQSQALDIYNNNKQNNKPKNPYRLFLLYKLRKKYEAKSYVYDIKKVNELIFNIPSHFTAIFKEYLIKEEEVEFLKRIYHRNEINKKLKKIFYFYDKFSKIYPNYIVVPEGHYLYRNILKKQKIIDKLQKMKEEEIKNKQMLLDGSFNTIFSNGAVDSIYSNIESINNCTLSNILFMDKNDNNEEAIAQIENIIENIEKYENIVDNTTVESLVKKQTIYKKEFKDIRSLSKSTKFKIQKDTKEISKEISKEKSKDSDKKGYEENTYKNNENKTKKEKKNSKSNLKINPTKNNIVGPITRKLVRVTDIYKYNTDDEFEKQNENNKNYSNLNTDSNNNNNYIDISHDKGSYKKININKDKKIEKNENNNNEDETKMKNKKKKFIILSGHRYSIKNTENDDKSIENIYTNYTNDDNLMSLKSKSSIPEETQLFYSKNNEDSQNNNSFLQNKNLSKDYISRKNNNSILYKKKLINDTRGISITKKTEFSSNTIITNKAKTTFTLNGTKIVPIRKFIINNSQDIPIKNTDKDNDDDNDNDNEHYLYIDKKKRILNNMTYSNNKQNINPNNYKTITYSKSNYELNEKNKNNISSNKNNNSLNGNIYYKKHKFDHLRYSNADKSCPREFNKCFDDISNDNNNYLKNSSEEKDKSQTTINNNKGHRYHRMNQYNNKKFRLKGPKNYFKIDVI